MKVAQSFLELKLALAQRLLATTDETMLGRIAEAMEPEGDWYAQLDEEDKKDIRLGAEEAAAGKLSSHDDVMERILACLRK